MKNIPIFDGLQWTWPSVDDHFAANYCRMRDTYRRGQQRIGECCCPRDKWWSCTTDCTICYYQIYTTSSIEINSLSTEPLEKEVEIKELFSKIDEILSRLTNHDRLIATYRLSEYSHAEIATIIGCSERTSKRSWHHTKILLRKELSDFK